jgi:hypothetical protein
MVAKIKDITADSVSKATGIPLITDAFSPLKKKKLTFIEMMQKMKGKQAEAESCSKRFH